MVGGGALFFAWGPARALIADANPELIGFYRAVVSDADAVLARHAGWAFDEETFYAVRALRWEELDAVTAAARLLYLNRACFNGLYRVNARGEFNVPWGRYARAPVIDRAVWERARTVLARARIELGDVRDVLRDEGRAGDFVFLDPPYVPVGAYSDFKRYTAAQFRDDDQRALAALVDELAGRGCELVVTNANAALVHELYAGHALEVVATRRSVNARGGGRTGEDVIVHVLPR